MQAIKQVSIIGTGVLGGSFAKALKTRHSDPPFIVGYDRPEIALEALALGIIDRAAPHLASAVHDADLVILATPIQTILQNLTDIAAFLKPNALVTDVGSVKSPILSHAQAVLKPETLFIGGHPMAGSERSGPSAADAFLFENATYVLCPPSGLDENDFITQASPLIDLIQVTGARLLILDAARHDRIAATISHLPQMIAVTMMNVASILNKTDDAFLKLAAGGFRDITRIASSAFPMWRDILRTNEPAIQEAVALFQAHLGDLLYHLEHEDLAPIQSAFETAREARNTIPKNSKGFLKLLVDVYVFAEDVPGFLYKLTKTLYDAGFNIKDMELLKIREGTGGAFRLSFDSNAEADAAIEALNQAGYVSYRL